MADLANSTNEMSQSNACSSVLMDEYVWMNEIFFVCVCVFAV